MEKENHTFERIIKLTGREPSECKCQRCQQQCKTPCLGTPDDILNLLNAGYRKQLSFTVWAVGLYLGVYPNIIPMIQAEKTSNGCAFLKDGLCSIHHTGLKPTEGKLSHHTITAENLDFKQSLAWNVAKEWLSEDNDQTIAHIVQLMLDLD